MSPCIHLLLNWVNNLLMHFGEKERAFWVGDILYERLIYWSFCLRVFGCKIEVSLNSFNILISRLSSSWFFNICGVNVFFFIIMVAIVVDWMTIRLKRNVMIFRNMRNRVSFCVELPFSSFCIRLRDIFLILVFKNLLFAAIHLLWDVDLSIRFRL